EELAVLQRAVALTDPDPARRPGSPHHRLRTGTGLGQRCGGPDGSSVAGHPQSPSTPPPRPSSFVAISTTGTLRASPPLDQTHSRLLIEPRPGDGCGGARVCGLPGPAAR